MRAMRPDVMSLHHVVVSGHPLTAQAGFQILEAGGNAIDAGVAVGIATAVVECQFVGFGGIAPSMIHLADSGEIVTLSGMGTWPRAASCEYFRDTHGGRIPAGLLRTVVPAAPDTWITALEKFGTLSFAEVAAAAIRFARDGFPMYPMLRDRLEGEAGTLATWRSSAAVFLPGGRLPEIGEIFVQSDLAATLQYLADEEVAQTKKGRAAGLSAAREAFYKGDVAAKIVQHQNENGGLMTADDMAGFRITIDPPCHARFGDIDLYGCGPISQGPMLLETLGILGGVDLAAMGHNSAPYIHTVVEALKLAAADREAYFGDPLFVDVPVAELHSEDYLAGRRAMIRPGEAWPDLPPPGAAGGAEPAPWEPDPSSVPAPEEAPLETSYFCVMDRHGNVFSATPSDGLTKTPIVAGTGLCASMWGSRGYTGAHHPSNVAPGKRPKMSSNPAIAMRKGKSVMAFGSPGAEVIAQAMTQAFLNVNVFGMDPQAAVEAPRFASYSWPASSLPHVCKPARLNLEGAVGRDIGDALAGLGHDIEWWPHRKWSAGSVCTIVKDLDTGIMHTGADPRRTAYAVGW
jgi:gamma-glutamyltranspeptidase/glutathione hydrolase